MAVTCDRLAGSILTKLAYFRSFNEVSAVEIRTKFDILAIMIVYQVPYPHGILFTARRPSLYYDSWDFCLILSLT